MNIDGKVRNKFENNLHQVFIYVIDECNLSCVQCLYKTQLKFHFNRKEIPFDELRELLHELYLLGARKVTFMGGEPTLYKKLGQAIVEAKEIGYTYVRIDTNGIFDSSLLINEKMKKLDEITFSLDGYSPEMNDPIRGEGVFNKCSGNIIRAIELGYSVQITTCIHDKLIDFVDGEYGVETMINYARKLGVDQINFHDLLKMNLPRDVWSGDIAPNEEEYKKCMDSLLMKINVDSKLESFVRLPQRLVGINEFKKNSNYYGYCSGKKYDRMLIFPDGTIRICSLLIGTSYYVATYDGNGMYWNENITNETNKYNYDVDTPCSVSVQKMKMNSAVPLCIAFKPKQKR